MTVFMVRHMMSKLTSRNVTRPAYRKILLYFLLAIGIFLIGNTEKPLASSTPDEISLSACPIEISSSKIANRDQHCHQRLVDSGTILIWATAKNRRYLAFISLNRAGPQLIFPHSDGTASSAAYHLSHFGYIKENWTAIEPAALRSIQTEDALDVRLYKIDLADEKGCIGFTRGIGGEDIGSASGRGHQTIASALICPRLHADSQELISILTKIRFK